MTTTTGFLNILRVLLVFTILQCCGIHVIICFAAVILLQIITAIVHSIQDRQEEQNEEEDD